MTAPEFESGDLVTWNNLLGVVQLGPSRGGNRVPVAFQHEGETTYPAAEALRHVTPTAEHADGNHWARGVTAALGFAVRGVVEDIHQRGLVGLRHPDGTYSEVTGAVLVAPPVDPAPVAPEQDEQDQPEWHAAGPVVIDQAGNGVAAVVAMFADPEDAARAVADHNEVERLRGDVAGRRQQVINRDRALERAAGVRKRVRDLLDRDRRALARVKAQRDEARAALAAAPGVGHDLPKVEVRREGDQLAATVEGDTWHLYDDNDGAVHRRAGAAYLALLAEREREAAQAQAPERDPRDESHLCGCDRPDLAEDPHRHDRDEACELWAAIRDDVRRLNDLAAAQAQAPAGDDGSGEPTDAEVNAAARALLEAESGRFWGDRPRREQDSARRRVRPLLASAAAARRAATTGDA